MKNLKPFDLERALAGDPVVTRNGRSVKQLTYFPDSHETYTIRGVIGNVIVSFTTDGKYEKCVYSNDFDLFMAPKTVEMWVCVFEDENKHLLSGGILDDIDAKYFIEELKYEYLGAYKIEIEL